MKTKTCPSCKNEVDLATLPLYRVKKWDYLCCDCQRQKGLVRNRKIQPQESIRARNKHLADPRKRMLSSALRRATKKGIDFTISIDDIVIPEYCPVLGIKLQVNSGKPKQNSPSLDRIDNSRGYVPGNVQVLSWRANAIKSDFLLSELEGLVKYIKSKKREPNALKGEQ